MGHYPMLGLAAVAVILLMTLILPDLALATQHPSFFQFASPISQYTISKNTIAFPTNQSTDSITLSMTDSAIYKYVNTSFNGQNWVQRTLLAGQPSSCTVHPDDTGGTWLTGTCTLSVPVAAANFSFTAPGTSRTRNYITAYSCTENVLDLGLVRFRLGWDCHGTTATPGMWQIWNFTAGLAAVASTCSDGIQNGDETGVDCGGSCSACSQPLTWTGELTTNGGFEWGNLSGWTVSDGGWAIGYYQSFGASHPPQSGTYCAYVATSSLNRYVYQDVDLSAYAAGIDAGTAVANVSGWGISSAGDYPYAVARIRFMLLNSAKSTISTPVDTGYVLNASWWRTGVSEYAIPSGTRYIRVWGNTQDSLGYSMPSGDLDSFSVKVRYGSGSCTDMCSSLGYECGTQTVCGSSVSCGSCGTGYTCNATGKCAVSSCTPSCTCASTTCTGSTCSDGCGGTCSGALAPVCTGRACGASLNGCGSCGTCALGNATSTCNATYQCAVSSCTSGYANCNGRSSDGCEVQLGMNATCANCTNACPVSQTCTNYVCTTQQSGTCGGVTCKTGEYCSNNACLLDVGTHHTYFVATTGNDNWPGTFAQPFATWQKAVTVSYPGDITYIRGGVYTPTAHIGSTGTSGIVIKPAIGIGRSGTAANPIRYFAYPPDYESGNFSILDCRLLGPVWGYNEGVEIEGAEYIHIKGLTVRNVYQVNQPNMDTGYQDAAYGFNSASSANIIFENCVAHDIMGRGFQHWSGAWNTWDADYALQLCIARGGTSCTYQPALFTSDNTSFINCDAYNLYDALSTSPGNAADGFKCGNYFGNTLYFYGCRAWNYSDDGFDPGGAGRKVIDHCWARATRVYDISQVWRAETNGFKTGGIGQDQYGHFPAGYNFVYVTNSIAADCMGSQYDDVGGVGFYFNLETDYYNSTEVNAKYYNNLVYNGRAGFFDAYASSIHGKTVRTCELRNNIAYANTDPSYSQTGIYRPSIYPASNNTWIPRMEADGWPGWYLNPAYNVNNADFVSLDTSQLTMPRKADGSLPDITFGHLAASSDLINKGAYVGLPYSGSAPDLGPFEYTG
jgi:hypothetical protein